METDEQITTAPVVTTADPYAPTESAPEGYTMITPNLNNWDTFGSKGQWKIYTCSTSEESHAYVAAKEGDTPYDINLNFVKQQLMMNGNAKGYRVQISKTKKFKKVLLTKNVKKA